jgi:hypothetical protein
MQSIPAAQLSKETHIEGRQSRDEVLELGALLVLLKLAFG